MAALEETRGYIGPGMPSNASKIGWKALSYLKAIAYIQIHISKLLNSHVAVPGSDLKHLSPAIHLSVDRALT